MLDRCALTGRHDARRNIILKRKNPHRLAADREGRAWHDGRDQRLETRPINWQFAFKERPLARNGCAERSGNGAHKGFGLNGVHEADLLHVAPQAVYPKGAVRVQHDFDDGGIVQITADARTQLAAEFFDKAPRRLIGRYGVSTESAIHASPLLPPSLIPYVASPRRGIRQWTRMRYSGFVLNWGRRLDFAA